jgi:MoxR-like ATPase
MEKSMKETDFPDWVGQVSDKVLDEASRFVIGKREITKNLLVGLLAGGHVLLEGVPGVAKTHIAKTFAGILGCKFTRIQFTPDLLPVDIIGAFVFDQKTSDFRLRKGPIFSNIVLIDEVNRGTPKTQSGTIEVMQERQVTIEGQTFGFEEPFMVIATKNPIEVEGVYQLVEAQIDRFMLQLYLDYPTAEEEKDLIEKLSTIEAFNVHRIITADRVRELASYVEKVNVSPDVKDYMIEIIRRTRERKELKLGASPRALIHLYKACKAKALVEGRDYVIPDDVKELTQPVLNHRIWLSRESETEGLKTADVVARIVNETPIPGMRKVGPQ